MNEEPIIVAFTRFPLGELVVTRTVRDHLLAGRENEVGAEAEPLMRLVRRHAAGQWGNIPVEDAAANEAAITGHERIHSVQTLDDGRIVWIITEADRSATTVLFPEDY